MKSKDPYAYKMGRVELMAEKSCFVLSRPNRKKRAASFSEFFKLFPELYGKINYHRGKLLIECCSYLEFLQKRMHEDHLLLVFV